MSYSIEEIEGIGLAYGRKLKDAGIGTTAALLERCGPAKGRKALAQETGIEEALILRWTNHADLMRIKGIGRQFAELLEASGVDTVKELRTRRAAALAAKLAEVNAAKKLSGTAPAEAVVETWIAQAKELAPAISH